LDLYLADTEVEKAKLADHPVGPFVLSSTEMWERFSYCGMRSLLTLSLISDLAKGGWAWARKDALDLYAWYTFLVYLTPIVGGFIADRLTGYRKAIVLGGIIMTLGHAAMAMEGFNPDFFYAGLFLLITGNGLFKPNISSMVG